MNRILLHLAECDCKQRERERERLKALGIEITERLAIEGVELGYYCHSGITSKGHGLVLSVCAEWTLNHPNTAREETCETLERLALDILAGVKRLEAEGGAA
jgi:hypothetical protein